MASSFSSNFSSITGSNSNSGKKVGPGSSGTASTAATSSTPSITSQVSKSKSVTTASSALALAQTQIVISALKAVHPDIEIRIEKISTKGDRDKTTPLWKTDGLGFFTTQIEDALLAGKADFAVHSYKDMPTEQTAGLTIAAVCQRDFPQDVLVSATRINSLGDLTSNATIGTSSKRRIAMLKHLRNDLNAVPIRGNVETRLNKLDAGEVDGIILARAGSVAAVRSTRQQGHPAWGGSSPACWTARGTEFGGALASEFTVHALSHAGSAWDSG